MKRYVVHPITIYRVYEALPGDGKPIPAGPILSEHETENQAKAAIGRYLNADMRRTEAKA